MIVFVALAFAAPLELLDAGSEPRAALALAPAAGQVDEVDVTMAFTATVVNEGMALPEQTIPTMELGLRAEAVEPGVSATVTLTRARAHGAKDLGPTVNEALQSLVGLRGSVKRDPHNRSLASTAWSTASGPAEPSEALEVERALELLQVRLPEEPVGVGARWTVTHQQTDELGFAVTETETWTVAARDGNRWTLDVTTLQQAKTPQPVGAHVLQSHTGAAQGRVVLDTDHLLPHTVEMGWTLRTRMMIDGNVESVTTSTLQAKASRTP